MIKIIVLSLSILLTGCGRMTYDDVKASEAYCESKGLTSVRYGGASVNSVMCQDKDDTQYHPVLEKK